MKKQIECTYFDSTEFRTYEEYVENCEDNNVEPQGENSRDFIEWLEWMSQLDTEDFFSNLAYCKLGECMILGTLGLWDGDHDIVPVLCDNVKEAIERICDGMRGGFHLRVTQKDGYLLVEQSHHDGTNAYEVRILSAKGRREVKRPCYEYDRDFDPKPWWFKKIKGYLY